MDDPLARRKERDQTLVRAMCEIARRLRGELAEWLQQELKDQKVSAQLVQSIFPQGMIRERAKKYEEDIDELSFNRLPDAIKEQKGRVEEIWSEFDDDPFLDYMYLEESVFRIERMARMVFAMRRLLDDLSDSQTEKTSAEGDDGEA